MKPAPILLFTDFGNQGPYLGQLELAVREVQADAVVINLCSDVPRWNPRAAAYLLAGYARCGPPGTAWVCVVDPGVGSFRDRPVVVHCEERWYVGPDNGQFDVLRMRYPGCRTWPLEYRPEALSSSFHGRDLYAPAAARLAAGWRPEGEGEAAAPVTDLPADGFEVIYLDHFGNAMTGIRPQALPEGTILEAAGHRFVPARTFSDLAPGSPLWYVNSNGLVELACNAASAAGRFGLEVGMRVCVVKGK